MSGFGRELPSPKGTEFEELVMQDIKSKQFEDFLRSVVPKMCETLSEIFHRDVEHRSYIHTDKVTGEIIGARVSFLIGEQEE